MWYSKVHSKVLLQHCHHGKKNWDFESLLPFPPTLLIRLNILLWLWFHPTCRRQGCKKRSHCFLMNFKVVYLILALESCCFMKTSEVSNLEKVSRFRVCAYTYIYRHKSKYMHTPFYSIWSDASFLVGIRNARAILNMSLFLELSFCPAFLKSSATIACVLMLHSFKRINLWIQMCFVSKFLCLR